MMVDFVMVLKDSFYFRLTASIEVCWSSSMSSIVDLLASSGAMTSLNS